MDQGKVQFSDNLWKTDFDTGRISIVYQFDIETNIFLGQESVGIDIINPFLDELEEYIFFTNKQDGSLWSLKLESGE